MGKNALKYSMSKIPQDSVMMAKGKVIVMIPGFIKKNFGEEGLIYWLHQITENARNVYESKIDENQWFPLKSILIEPIANIAHLFFKWDLKKTAWALGRYSAEHRFSGISRLTVKFPSPNSFIDKDVEFLSDYYRPCQMKVVKNKQGQAIVQIIKFPDIDLTTEYRIGGWIERGLELNGCKDLQVEINKSLVRFDPCTEYSIRWKSKNNL